MAKKEIDKKINYFHAEFKVLNSAEQKDDKGIGGTVIRGLASTPGLDRYNDSVEPQSFRDSILKNYRKNPILLFQHNQERPIGIATFMSIDEKGLYIEGNIVDKEIEPKIQLGILRSFSIGYIPKQLEYQDELGNKLNPDNDSDFMEILFNPKVKRIIKEVDLVEISIVSVPANPEALFTIEKSIGEFFDDFAADKLSAIIENDNSFIQKNKDKILLKYANINQIISKKMKKLLQKENLLEVKEEGKKDDENIPQPEKVEEPKKEEVPEPKKEENQNIEPPKEQAEPVSEKPLEVPNAEISEPNKEEEEKKFDFDLKLCAPENVKKMIEVISMQEKTISRLEEKLSKIPAKEALAFSEHKQFSGIKKVEEEPEENTKKGFKEQLFNNAN